MTCEWTGTIFLGVGCILLSLKGSLKDFVHSYAPSSIHNALLLKSALPELSVFHGLVCSHALKLVDELEDYVQEGFLLQFLMVPMEPKQF